MSMFRTRALQALRVISIALFTALVLVVMWQVITRQLLNSPSGWTTTVAQYLFIWLVLFSVAMVFGERGHVAVDFFAGLLPAPLRRIAQILVTLAVLAFATLGLVWGGIRGMGISWDQAITGLPVTIGQMYTALPVAGVLIVVFAIGDLIQLLRGDDLDRADDDAPAAVTVASPAGTRTADRQEH